MSHTITQVVRARRFSTIAVTLPAAVLLVALAPGCAQQEPARAGEAPVAKAAPPAQRAPAAASRPSIDPEADRLLKRMCDYMSGLDRFSMKTENMYEDVLDSGQKIMRGFTSRVAVQRPDKIRAERQGDEAGQVLVYDGETLTFFDPGHNVFGRVGAPDNIDDFLHFARDALDIVPPTGDMIYANSYELLKAGVTSGQVIGKANIDGVPCDHLAFTTPVVDWQVWIAEGDRPLPLKYVLTTRDDPAQPQFITFISDWDVGPLNRGQFSFTPPAGAKEIEFLRMDRGDVANQ